MLQITTNGSRGPVPVGPDIKGVPPDLRELFAVLADTEVPMNETAAEKLMAAIGKNHEAVLARIDSVKDQYHALDKRITAFEGVTGTVRELDIRLDGIDGRLKDVDTRLKETNIDVTALKKIEETAEQDKKADRRTVRDSLLRYGSVGLIGGLITMGGFWVKAELTPPPEKPAQVQPDPQAGISNKLDTLIEEIRTDRAARESEPQTIKVPPRKPPRRPPEPQRLNRLHDGDLIATPVIPLPVIAFSTIPIPAMRVPE